MSRLVVLLLALVLLVPAPAALAQQGGAFEPLPPAQPTPVPTVAPDDPTDDDVGRTTLYVIGGLLLLSFVGLAVWITRDARRAVPDEPRRPATPDDELLEERRHKLAGQAKVRARKKARAQRAARRRNRR